MNVQNLFTRSFAYFLMTVVVGVLAIVSTARMMIEARIALDLSATDAVVRVESSAGESDRFCGGMAGIQCPRGYSCELDGSYPDAGGTCVLSEEEKTIFDTAEWQTYRNNEHGFAFQYPGITNFEVPRVERREGASGFRPETYIRIQNYDPNSVMYNNRLQPEEYYLEVRAYMSAADPNSYGFCDPYYFPEQIVFESGVIGHTGPFLDEAGEAGGGGGAVLCLNDGPYLVMNIVQPNEETTLAKQIISTFEFTQ